MSLRGLWTQYVTALKGTDPPPRIGQIGQGAQAIQPTPAIPPTTSGSAPTPTHYTEWTEAYAPGTRLISAAGEQPLAPGQQLFLEGLKAMGILDPSGRLGGYDFYGERAPWRESAMTGPTSFDFANMERAFDGQWGQVYRDGREPITLLKADAGVYDGIGTPVGHPKGVYWDPFAMGQSMGYRDRPTWMTYAMCQQLAFRCVIIGDVIQLRAKQVAGFCRKRDHKFEPGILIRLKDRTKKPTPAERKMIEKLEELVYRGSGADSFSTMLQKLLRDSLTFDQLCFTKVPDRLGRPCQWRHIDAATIRLTYLKQLYDSCDPNQTFAVQLADSVVVETFNRKELAFRVRNPRTDRIAYGYGLPESEVALSAISTFLNAWNHNAAQFTNGHLQPGFLNLSGFIPEEKLQEFRRQFYLQTSGAHNSWRTPVFNADKVEYVQTQKSNRDQEFGQWMDFNVKLVLACYNTDSTEIGIRYGNQGQKSQQMEGANKSKVVESKDKGLRPLLQFLSEVITEELIRPWSDDFICEFVGLDAMSPKEQADLITQRVRSCYTVDEIRAELDRDPMPDEKGQVLLDATWMQYAQTIDQKKDSEKQAKAAHALEEAQIAAIIAIDEGKQLSNAELGHIAQLLSEQSLGMGAGAGPGAPGGPPPPGAGGTPVDPTPGAMGKSLEWLGWNRSPDSAFDNSDLAALLDMDAVARSEMRNEACE